MWVRHWLALSAYASGDLETARATAAEIVRIGRGGGSRWDESIGEWLLGVLAHGQGRHDDARAHLEASRALSTDPRLPFPLGRSLLGLAELAREDEDLDEAWELAHDSLEVLDDYGDRVGAAAALETIADLAVALGEPERSLRLLAASQRFHTDTGIARFPFQADRFDRARNSGTSRAGPHRRDRMLGRGRRAVAGRRGRLCPPRAGRASTPADRLGVTDSRRTRRRAAGRRRPHQRRDRCNACSSPSTRSRSTCPTSTPRWTSTDARISPHRLLAATCSTTPWPPKRTRSGDVLRRLLRHRCRHDRTRRRETAHEQPTHPLRHHHRRRHHRCDRARRGTAARVPARGHRRWRHRLEPAGGAPDRPVHLPSAEPAGPWPQRRSPRPQPRSAGRRHPRLRRQHRGTDRTGGLVRRRRPGTRRGGAVRRGHRGGPL